MDEFAREEIMSGRYPFPLAGANRVDLADLAHVAQVALTDPDFPAGEYPIVGPNSISGADCAAEWSRALGRPVQYTGDDAHQWMAFLGKQFSGQKLADMQKTYTLLAKRTWPTDVKEMAVTERLLKRPPTSYRDYVDRMAHEWLGLQTDRQSGQSTR
ncbi:hypothetical protein [Kribbella albertanoniae]|uniref:NmrA-like domain-containing protein n=1 Tax=Kribbella albertanoniae TaxID=1266829 RepID=A0A4R4Q7E2_9ACTN|nr:hypothetical protein [Kribbella albertanoniae]TDC30979.1 hypothetical protein E1261_12020 [Kribbella albertanoniae]